MIDRDCIICSFRVEDDGTRKIGATTWHGMVGPGRQGTASHGSARLGKAGLGAAGQVWHGRQAWPGLAWLVRLRLGRAGPGPVGQARLGGSSPGCAGRGSVGRGVVRQGRQGWVCPVLVRRVRARSGKAGKAWWVSSGHGRSRRGVVGFGEAGMAWLGASGRVVVCPGLVRRVRRGLLRRVESWLGPSGPGWAGCGWLGWAGPVAAWHGTSRRVSSRPVLVGFGEAGAASRGRSGQVPASPVLARQAGYPAIETRSVPRAQARPHHLEVAHHL
jgi:hypothetical protein